MPGGRRARRVLPYWIACVLSEYGTRRELGDIDLRVVVSERTHWRGVCERLLRWMESAGYETETKPGPKPYEKTKIIAKKRRHDALDVWLSDRTVRSPAIKFVRKARTDYKMDFGNVGNLRGVHSGLVTRLRETRWHVRRCFTGKKKLEQKTKAGLDRLLTQLALQGPSMAFLLELGKLFDPDDWQLEPLAIRFPSLWTDPLLYRRGLKSALECTGPRFGRYLSGISGIEIH